MLESLPGIAAFYANSLAHSMVEGFAATMRGRPFHAGAFGTIETMARTTHDRPVVFDARRMIGAPERVVREDGRERSVVTLRLPGGRTARIKLDVPREQLEGVLRKAVG
jgi:hypothetical protein